MRTQLVASFVLAVGALLAGGCESSPPSRAARTEVAPVAAPAAPAPAGSTVTAASTTAAAPHAMCGGSCGGQCGGQSCGAGCMGGAEVAIAAAPADARWTSLHVTGMHCGGCAKRIKNALAGVEGVVGVEVDLGKAEVRVATTTGDALLARVTQTIDGLGFKATAN